MSEPLSIAITLAAGAAGGLLARALRLPGGAIIGAMVAAAAAHLIIAGLLPLNSGFRTAAQILIGAVIGVTVKRSPLLALRAVLLPVLVVLAVLIGSSLLLAGLFTVASDLPLVTALFSTAPGGASDMAAAALRLNADVGLIAAIHVVRQVAIFVLLVPLFSRRLARPAPLPHGVDQRQQ